MKIYNNATRYIGQCNTIGYIFSKKYYLAYDQLNKICNSLINLLILEKPSLTS